MLGMLLAGILKDCFSSCDELSEAELGLQEGLAENKISLMSIYLSSKVTEVPWGSIA